MSLVVLLVAVSVKIWTAAAPTADTFALGYPLLSRNNSGGDEDALHNPYQQDTSIVGRDAILDECVLSMPSARLEHILPPKDQARGIFKRGGIFKRDNHRPPACLQVVSQRMVNAQGLMPIGAGSL